MAAAGSSTEQGYSGKRTAEIVGITYRQLDYWARTDLIRPTLTDATGSGSRRLYAYADPTGCNCLLVGDAQAYQRYQQLVDVPEAAVEAEVASKVNEEDADDAGTDWEYANGPLWW